jgi:phage gpG-like protein
MIEGQVLGTEVIKRFNAAPAGVLAAVHVAIQRLSITLENKVKDKLNGQVLKVRTGRLRNSITNAVQTQGQQVTGIVSTAVSYARVHEYGFTGTEQVGAHLRLIKQAWGKPITPREISVRAHSRKVNLPARSFLRSALREMDASGAIAKGINKAVRGMKA